jgi:plasmid stabilization system protein ParE
MKPRKLLVTPQASRDFTAIVAWYKQERGARAAGKVVRTLQAGVHACARISLSQAKRADLPEGYFRVVAKTHLIVFKINADTARIVRILHGARNIAAALEQDKD